MITAERYARSGDAILEVTEPADRTGVTICLDAGTKALRAHNYDVAGAMLDEAAARARIISSQKLVQLHEARLAGARQ